jgi:cardiolipin synthase
MHIGGRLLSALNAAPVINGGNRLRLLCNGDGYFPSLLTALSAAQQTIRLETYLYADDAIGDAVTQTLCDAAQRGVDVRLVVDGFGARNIDTHHLPLLLKAGVQVRIFRPEQHLWRHLLSRKRTRLRRMHRKMALIDGQTAFLGGINIIDDATGNSSPTRLDFALAIEGPIILQIGQAMDRQWLTLSRRPFFRHGVRPMPTPVDTTPVGSIHCGLLLRDNLMHRLSIEQAYIEGIQSAKNRITLAMAYFIPSRNILSNLLDAAQRGVRIDLILQGRVEYRLQHYASQSLYHRLLVAGVHIHEYQPGLMHAKVGVIDGRWATLGSANLDPFSLLVAREANLIIHDSPFCQALEQELSDVITQDCREITVSGWARHSGLHRALRIISARILFRLLSLTRYADN